MKTETTFPISLIGRGSQPLVDEDSQLGFIAMPKEMDRYHAPDIPEPEAVSHLHGAKAVTDWLVDALREYRVGGPAWLADISSLDAANRELVNQILGEGEVSLKYEDGVFRVRMQESVLAGIWRTLYLDGEDRILRDLIEVCDVPVLARRPPDTTMQKWDVQPTDGVMNALPILSEIHEKIAGWQPGAPTHTINLTLLPLSDGDIEYLGNTLGLGPVETLSRGYGECKITSTATPGVWWVQFTNSMGTVILNTIEVTDIPAVACAAPEDLQDSFKRFRELLEPYWADLQ